MARDGHTRPGAYQKGFERMQRDQKLLRALAEEAAREPCQRRQTAPYDCLDLPDYSHTLWCLPCKARETLDKVNTPL